MRALYDDWAAGYDADLEDSAYKTPGRVAEALSAALADKQAPVLDFACGTGLSGVALADAGFKVIDGADISSLSADLVVTTPRRTSLRFWQRDGNKVVLPNAQCSYAYTHGTHANIRRVTMPKRSINMLAGMPHCRSQKPARRWQLPPDVRLPACQSSGCWNLRFCGAYHEGGMRI